MNKGQLYFEKDILKVVKSFPGLTIVGNPGYLYLHGILDIPDNVGIIVSSYLIEVRYAEGYPYRFPKLLEVGGDIPIDNDWHKYADSSLCLDVEASEILKCRRGLHVKDFLKDVAIPHLANQYYRSITGEYVNEYMHGAHGIREFYINVFKTEDTNMWILCANRAFVNRGTGRNDLCYCGSGKRYKHCHLDIDDKLRLIGISRVMNDFNKMGVI